MLEISLDEKNLQDGLAQLLRNATETRPMMRAIATEMAAITEGNFEAEAWGAKRWPKSKRAAQRGKTLQLSGQLAASITTQSGNGFARIGSNKKYAAIHHMGGKAGRDRKVSIPDRPYLPIDKTDELQANAETALLNIALESLKKGLQA